MTTPDLFALYEGTWQFWSEHHEGQASRGYAILSRASRHFEPGPCHKGWPSLDEDSRDVYRAWCDRENVPCPHDTVEARLAETCYERGTNDLIDYFLDHYGDETLEDSGLENYERSDFVNLDMCYTRDLIRFYDDNESELEEYLDQTISDYGATSLLEFMEGETIESVSDLKTAIVNRVMSSIAYGMLATLQND